MKPKLVRVTTVSGSLDSLLKGQLAFLNQYYEVIGLASGRDILRELGNREGIRTIEVKMHREISLLADLKSLFGLIKVFHREKPFIVHANTPKGSLLSIVAAWITRVPHRIYTVTGLRFETTTGLFRQLLILMERITCFCATKVIPEGDGVKETLIREKITSKPLRKVLNGNISGIDMHHYTRSDEVLNRAKELGINKDHFTFCYVGRMVRDKGINELIRAFTRLYNEHSSVRLLLVGFFEKELDPVLKEIEQLILTHKGILFTGYQSDVRPWFVLSDALVFPSYREGFPNVVMQAGAMELPSIVTNINGCNEIIVEGKNGIIIPPKEEDALYYAMSYFISHPGEVSLMAKNARSMIESRYEQSRVWNALLSEYKQLK